MWTARNAMSHRLTPYASHALLRAREEAAASGKRLASPEHLLAALVEIRDGMASRVLARAGVPPEHVDSALALFVRRAGEPAGRAELSLEVRRILGMAYEEAARLR